jgi:hypothetical protein
MAGVEAESFVEILDGIRDIVAVEIKKPDIILVLGVFFPRLLDLFLGVDRSAGKQTQTNQDDQSPAFSHRYPLFSIILFTKFLIVYSYSIKLENNLGFKGANLSLDRDAP